MFRFFDFVSFVSFVSLASVVHRRRRLHRHRSWHFLSPPSRGENWFDPRALSLKLCCSRCNNIFFMHAEAWQWGTSLLHLVLGSFFNTGSKVSTKIIEQSVSNKYFLRFCSLHRSSGESPPRSQLILNKVANSVWICVVGKKVCNFCRMLRGGFQCISHSKEMEKILAFHANRFLMQQTALQLKRILAFLGLKCLRGSQMSFNWNTKQKRALGAQQRQQAMIGQRKSGYCLFQVFDDRDKEQTAQNLFYSFFRWRFQLVSRRLPVGQLQVFMFYDLLDSAQRQICFDFDCELWENEERTNDFN